MTHRITAITRQILISTALCFTLQTTPASCGLKFSPINKVKVPWGETAYVTVSNDVDTTYGLHTFVTIDEYNINDDDKRLEIRDCTGQPILPTPISNTATTGSYPVVTATGKGTQLQIKTPPQPSGAPAIVKYYIAFDQRYADQTYNEKLGFYTRVAYRVDVGGPATSKMTPCAPTDQTLGSATADPLQLNATASATNATDIATNTTAITTETTRATAAEGVPATPKAVKASPNKMKARK